MQMKQEQIYDIIKPNNTKKQGDIRDDKYYFI